MTSRRERPDRDPAPAETTTPARKRPLTRRRFVGLIAAGATAALAAPALGAAAPASRRVARAVTPAHGAIPAKVEKGLAEQRESLAKTLHTLRAFELPTGSEQGFAFRPLPARRKP